MYSNILNVNLDIRKTTMLLYPNPVTGGTATLTLGGLKPGRFDSAEYGRPKSNQSKTECDRYCAYANPELFLNESRHL
jgi:hypothetical protein